MSSEALSLPPVLAPKLQLPRLRPSLVQREALQACLDAASERRLTVVSAPAGYGKTTLASAWATHRNTCQASPAVAWLALDEGDNDPIRFWRYFITACQELYPGVGRTTLALLQSPLRLQPERLQDMVVSSFLNDLSSYTQVGMVVLEDYHVIVTPEIHKALARLFQLHSSGLRLILLTRSDPPLPLARLRASDDLYELRSADLRFTLEETRLFLRNSLDHPLPDKIVQHLYERAEGWPAGIQLASLALRGHENTPEAEQIIADLSGRHRHIQEYLVDEILREQPEHLQTFLLQTSLLDGLTSSLCDAVTGRTDSAAALEHMERANMFLQPLDGAQVWYRYHALFAEAMQHEAQRRLGEEEIYACLKRASAWFERKHMLPEAIETAMRAHDFTNMANLIIRLVEPWGDYFEHQTLWRWLRTLPPEAMEAQPGLGFLYAVALLFTQDRYAPLTKARIEVPLRLAERYWHDEGNVKRLAQILAFRALVALWQEEYAESFRLARESLVHLADHEVQWRGMSLLNVSLEDLWAGRFDKAWEACIQARQLLTSCGSTSPMLASIAAQAEMSHWRGQLHQASTFYKQILAEMESQNMKEYWLDDKGGALLGLAHLSYEWNMLECAEQQAREALSIGQHRKTEELKIRALFLLARITGQQEYARNASSLLTHVQRAGLRRELLLEQASVALVHGNLATARRWSANLPCHEESLTYLLRERETLVTARLLIAQEYTAKALSVLSSLLPQAREQGRVNSELECLTLMVLAHATEREDESALLNARRLLLLALEKAHPEGYQRLFLDKGEPMCILLRTTIRDISDNSLRVYAHELIRHFSGPDTVPGEDLLSPQEVRVLRLLAAGRSRPEIASELIVSVNTIKTQIRSIYHKLNVSSRKDAYDAAKRLHLL
ncbi:LuxR C-terminal-related transcriptional regulator [Ktedonobacter racemifer]|uniref:ATP-dependent transcriptional regulator, MalT-like, LuxR family n=1 Tax=Ktedonobacter racemifer DSM 44963 TaxID=485913 RepID=D6U5B2_KTERA|nr:LuxR C-terminal-related transcriptional regulator [Ktedonobacter racemifer]EFH81692.1 ATP-dependent transcriptional regulator, MalT-like, LuxR family [Ktedonobacter racemifer DSM 44963]